ncbi:class I SAM-dependent RNA methyltransferase, partial [Candidatus Parcubacteria bacterium]|nr:class I SAM-dependent RNA methyltransferase [Candidatus Parcubacteria bacterium]
MSKKLPPEFEVTIEKFSQTGEGVGQFENRSIFVWGALLGEKLLVKPIKLSRGKAKAEIVKILEVSSLRRDAKENHFLTCSPWQIMPESEQIKLKKKIIGNMFLNINGKLPIENFDITKSRNNWSYRNKMEFSFALNDNKKLSLAFHERGKYWSYYKFDECVLAIPKISELSKKIIKELIKQKVKIEDLKNLVVRYSYNENKCLAILYVVKEDFKIFDFKDKDLVGFQIIYSNPLSPATVITKLLHKQGKDYLIEKISGVKLKYFHNSFFQISPPDFSVLIDYIKTHIKKGKLLVDLYSGVGTIGFMFTSIFEKIISVEFDIKAVEAAKENMRSNNLKNVELFDGATEKQELDNILKNADTLIVDPPRSGLHPKVI